MTRKVKIDYSLKYKEKPENFSETEYAVYIKKYFWNSWKELEYSKTCDVETAERYANSILNYQIPKRIKKSYNSNYLFFTIMGFFACMLLCDSLYMYYINTYPSAMDVYYKKEKVEIKYKYNDNGYKTDSTVVWKDEVKYNK